MESVPHRGFDPYGGDPPPADLSAHLLVATPKLTDPNFARRTILVLDYSGAGALGIVLDYASGVGVDEVLPRWHQLAVAPAELFVGGPVDRTAVIGVARLRAAKDSPSALPPGWRMLVDDGRPLGLVDLDAPPESIVDSVGGVRLFSGYAGWGPGQLEDEIDEGSWFVVPAQAGDPLSADPEGLWKRVLRRQGGSLAIVSGYPADPAAN